MRKGPFFVKISKSLGASLSLKRNFRNRTPRNGISFNFGRQFGDGEGEVRADIRTIPGFIKINKALKLEIL